VNESFVWLNKAESDLKHARHSMKNKDYDWVQLASQQAAEKALKAVCIQKGIGLIRTHELTILARKVKAPKNLIEKSALLNPFYTASRYPDAEEAEEGLSEVAAKDAIKAAEEVVKWCKNQIKT
jgi:HEPN domain-containing protein